jgi:hypothetical protein
MTVHTRQRITARSRLARGVARVTRESQALPQPEAGDDVPTASGRPVAQQRERRAGGPEDTARYHCHCGFVFDAAVSASVACPHCGGAQAW